MTDVPRPWWSSLAEQPAGTGAQDDALDDVDPIEAFRSARRPRPTPPRAAEQGSVPDPSPPTGNQDEPTADREPEDPVTHRPELCGVCPLCTLARTLEETRPELMGHLTEAARHLAAAARALLETPPGRPEGSTHAEPPQDTGPASARRGGVQRIPLDGRADPRTGPGQRDEG
ncbi:MAG: hypothetical protein EA340_03890 [Nitriliruptor sp.]|nr:MAG: hypothetical protein EA340_03890 [Nitriliruptor sp.]